MLKVICAIDIRGLFCCLKRNGRGVIKCKGALNLKNTAVVAGIEISDLEFAIEGRQILDRLSFRSDEAKIGIIGRNGSGKTTLARLLAGLIAPTQGNLRLAGVDVATDRKAALSTVGILFQNPDHQIIFPTVVEEVAFGLRQQGNNKAKAEALARSALDEFGKTHWAEANIQSLSQGQRHLVCLMAVLAMRPKVLVLDEPFAGLDIPTKMQLSRYLERADLRIVHISHDPDDLREYDLILWLDKGQICKQGAAKPVLDAYVEEMTRLGGGDDISHVAG